MIKLYENELPLAVRNDGSRAVSEYTHKDWVNKIKEELLETVSAGSPEEMAEEITDIITVCTSWLESNGYDLNERKRLFKAVNIKNQGRGYFDYMESKF